MNLELVQNIVALLGEYPVSEIAVESNGHRVHAVRPLSAVPPPPIAALPPEPEAPGVEAVPETSLLTAPMVGIFYHADPPLPFGAKIAPGEVVGTIESMKLMNDVAADTGGVLIDILVEDGAPVDYGRALFRLSVP